MCHALMCCVRDGPRAHVLHSAPNMRPVHIIGVPLDLGGNRRGVDMGPSAFRIAGLGERLTALGVHVVDKGDLVAPIPEVKSSGDPRKKYIREIARVCEQLYKASLKALEDGGFRWCSAAITAWRRDRWRRRRFPAPGTEADWARSGSTRTAT